MSDEPKIPTLQDIERLQKALQNERKEHAATKALAKTTDARIAAAEAKVTEAADRVALAEARYPNAAKLQEHVNAAAAAKVATDTAMLTQKLATLAQERDDALKASTDARAKLHGRIIADEVRNAARADHVLPDAVNDLLSLANSQLKVDRVIDAEGREVDGDRIIDAEGRDVAEWLNEQKSLRGYFWPVSKGAGARGSDYGEGAPLSSSGNPFKAGADFSLTRQGELVKSNPTLANRLQSEARLMH